MPGAVKIDHHIIVLAHQPESPIAPLIEERTAAPRRQQQRQQRRRRGWQRGRRRRRPRGRRRRKSGPARRVRARQRRRHLRRQRRDVAAGRRDHQLRVPLSSRTARARLSTPPRSGIKFCPAATNRSISFLHAASRRPTRWSSRRTAIARSDSYFRLAAAGAARQLPAARALSRHAHDARGDSPER